jgi:hypothetical protein
MTIICGDCPLSAKAEIAVLLVPQPTTRKARYNHR